MVFGRFLHTLSQRFHIIASKILISATSPAISFAIIASLSLVFQQELSAQPAPKGELVDILGIADDDQVVCSFYINKSKTEIVLSRIDEKKLAGKTFWSASSIKKQILVLNKIISKYGKSKAKANLKKTKKAINERKLLSKAKQQISLCAKSNLQSKQNSMINFSHVRDTLKNNCLNCHEVLGWKNEESYYKDNGKIVPGDIENSPLYAFLSNNPEGFQPAYMPKGAASLTSFQIMLISRWIRDSAISTVPSPSPTPEGANPLARELYTKYCSSCHGSFDNSAKAGRSEAQLRAALLDIPQMRFLKLTDDEIKKIVEALQKTAPRREGTLSVRALGSAIEGSAGSKQKLTFEITLRGKTSEPFSVGYVTSNGTALADSDFVFSAGSLNFAGNDGETRQVAIDVIGDDFQEATESLFLDIGGISVGTVVAENSTAEGLILNDDNAFIEYLPVQANRLRLAYGFNGNFLDAVGVANGIPQGDASISNNSKVGNGALGLTEGADYVSVPTQAFTNLTNFTLATWVYWENTLSTTSRIFDFGSITPNSAIYFTPRDSSNRCRFELIGAGTTFTLACNTGVTMPANRWVHVSLTFNSTTDEMKIYFDGQQMASRTGVTLNPSSISFLDNKIGKSRVAGSTDFRGRLDELTIWDSALTQPEIVQVMAMNSSPLLSSTIDVRFNNQPLTNGGSLNVGNAEVGKETSIAIYIHNRGIAGLTLPALPKISIQGRDATEFSAKHQPWSWQSMISNGSFAVFSLTFTPSSPGSKNATLLISNSDKANGNFALALNAAASGEALPLPPPPAENGSPLQQGQYLYAVNCSSCHGAIERSQKLGTTKEKISAATNSVSGVTQMRALNLTIAQIELIALALNSAPPASNNDTVEKVVVNIGTAKHVASALSEIFLPADVSTYTADDNLIKAAISDRILGVAANGNAISNRVRFFGGRCDRFEDNCQAEARRSSMRPVPNTLRSGYILATCNTILGFDKAVDNALLKIGRNANAQVSPADTKEMYNLLHPGRPMPDYLNDVIANFARGKIGLSARDHWRFQLHLFCAASEWEVN